MFDTNLENYISGMPLNSSSKERRTHVHMALHKITNTFVVIKKYFVDDKDLDDYSLIQQEIITARQLQHNNVLPYLSAFVFGHDIYVISPLMTYGSCSNLIKNHFMEGFPELACAFIVRDVLQGLDYLHKKGVIHRALKASHILISAQGQACICGLRYSCEVIKSGLWQRTIFAFPKSSTNNLTWLSPELLQQDLRGYNEKSDIYSLGITICELANGVVPFADVPETLMLTEKVQGNIPKISDGLVPNYVMDTEQLDGTLNKDSLQNTSPSVRQKFSETINDVVQLCFQIDPNNRPNASELLAHEFFKQCKKTDITLLDILKSVKPLNECFSESTEDLENQAIALTAELKNIEIDSCSWDFEMT